ncbi:LysR family transcriptional regulator [Alicyclobacillus sp. SO9]|uniref:LysR family transcriptional regulator n=1 Tax=Alicyclobacillus sp. SO9 TaxID=2665646 RepID=UPI0018E8AD30|nr:LysR family transcriptional regulator [Alicyclobacillus sp. SO9]QQE79296.1 LysR family transcriptional regulator [Alicyclobacillus sp. SO9]
MAITLQQLKVFLAVIDAQSISAAAQQLELRQSTVSFHMQALESVAGIPLLIRNHHRWNLTEAGKELVGYARTLTSTAAEAERVLADFQSDRQRRLLIGTSQVPATYIVPIVVERFHALRPDIALVVENVPSPMVRRRVEEREIDVGFIIDARPVPPALESNLVLEDEIGCVFSPNTGLQWLKAPITPDQLQAIELIGHAKDSSTAQVCDNWALNQGVSLKTSVTLGSIDMIKTAVKRGMGAALLSELMVRDEIEKGDLLYAPVHNPPRRQLRLIYHREQKESRLQDFVKIVQSTAQASLLHRRLNQHNINTTPDTP